MVPSSANVPCMMGNAKSSGRNAPSASWRPGRVGSETRCTGRDGDGVEPLQRGGVEVVRHAPSGLPG